MPKSGAAVVRDWYADMGRLFKLARFREAGETYDAAVENGARPTPEAQLLRGRVYLKHDENKAVSFLIRHQPRQVPNHLLGLWSMYLAVGYARMRDFDRADHHFSQADRRLRDRSDRASLAYHVGRRLLLEGRTGEVWQRIEEMSHDRSPGTRIDRELLRSFAFGHQEQYIDEARSLIAAIAIIGEKPEAHLERWFHAVENLAVLGRELGFDEAASIAQAAVGLDVDWPDDFALQRFQALKAVGWTKALGGDTLGCFRYLRQAEFVAPSDALKTIVLLDRARFARLVGERTWAEDEVATAEALSEEVDWHATTGDERVALLLLAESFAETDQEKSRFFLARYSRLDKIRSPLHLFAFDHRLEAMAAYVTGIVQLEAGDPQAEDSLRKAWVSFDRIGYDWRAGRSALALYRATGKPRWLHLAEDKLESYSRSWLGEELRLATAGRRYKIDLPPMQGKVFEMLCRQMSTEQIAKELRLSPHTVRNHLKAVFRAYGVNNKAALVAEAARRGALPNVGSPSSAQPAVSKNTRRDQRVRQKGS